MIHEVIFLVVVLLLEDHGAAAGCVLLRAMRLYYSHSFGSRLYLLISLPFTPHHSP